MNLLMSSIFGSSLGFAIGWAFQGDPRTGLMFLCMAVGALYFLKKDWGPEVEIAFAGWIATTFRNPPDGVCVEGLYRSGVRIRIVAFDGANWRYEDGSEADTPSGWRHL